MSPTPTAATPPWVSSTDELAALVRPGDRLAVGGVHFTRAPVAALLALADRGVQDLVYVAWGGGLPLEILLAHDLVRSIEICFSNADTFGPAPRFRDAAESGRVPVLDRTALQLLSGLRATAEKLPWDAMQEPSGSDFASRLSRIPGSGVPVSQVEPIRVDSFLLHAARADDLGNVEIEGARATDVATALAAERVLVTVEERVRPGTLGRRRGFVLPRTHVTAVVVAPLGAYPTSCLPYYPVDLERVGAAFTAPTAQELGTQLTPDPARVRRLNEIAQLPTETISRKLRDSRPKPGSPTPYTPEELIICLLARTVDDTSICTCGSSAPLPVAAYLLAKRLHAPRATILSLNSGFLDIQDRPLSLSLAEQQDFATAAAHTGADDSYRWYYQPGRVTHEVVSAAQIDAYGATNNQWIDGAAGPIRLPGQGGMADVANLHRDFVIYLPRHSRRNTVERVSHVSARRAWTSANTRAAYGYPPGRMRVITNLCVLEPDPAGGRLRVTGLHPGVNLDDVRSATGFHVDLAPDCRPTEPPTAEELRLLREEVDPLGVRRLDTTSARDRQGLIQQILTQELAAVLERTG